MDWLEFYDQVENHLELSGEMVINDPQNPLVIVKHLISGLRTCVPLAVIARANWEIIEDILTCKREPVVLQHLTRVVGYFSRIDNWNKSKLGELKDRQKGNYKINEQDRPRDGASR